LNHGQLEVTGSVETVIREYLGYSKASTEETPTDFPLGDALVLRRLDFRPRIVTSGQGAAFEIEILARKSCRLMGLVLLLYSEQGIRVAIMDFRRAGMHDLVPGGASLLLSGNIRALPLVEGDYRLGLHVETLDYQRDVLDLGCLSVVRQEHDADLLPHPAAYRGYLEIDYTFTVQDQRRANHDVPPVP
jgi:hypothetical protein